MQIRGDGGSQQEEGDDEDEDTEENDLSEVYLLIPSYTYIYSHVIYNCYK